ncbi:MAG: cupin domain-containing protein [Candidatus Bathyarchaeota archaeon]|nr:cupin domain-containing protein [Candidatus Bathyarchaeota archaeon]
MKISKVNETNSFKNAHTVDARKIYATIDAEVIHMTLTSGQALKRHTTPVDVFFYILEGTGIVEVGEETREVEKDTIIDSPKGIPHLLRNTGEGVFRFLVVKLPKTA